MSKKSLLVISQNFYPEIGSAGNRIKNIYQLLNEEYEVHVLTTEASYPNKKLYSEEQFWHDRELNEDEQIYRVKVANRKYTRNMFNRLLYYLEMMCRMIWMILFSKSIYDAVFVTSPPIFLGVVGILAKFRFKAKLILDVRDLWPDSLRGVGVFNYKWIISLFRMMEKSMYNRADSIVINSQGFYSHIAANLKKDKPIYFVPNSIRKEELVFKEQRKGEFSAVYSGNIGLAQDIEFLKQLSQALYKKEIRLNVVGFGLKKGEFQQFVKEHKLHNVHFIRAMTRKECLNLIKQNNVGVLCLKDEEVFDTVLPGKLIDYIACGLPIAAGASGHIKALIEEKGIGYVSESRNVEEIVQFIVHLKNHQHVAEAIALNNQKVIHRDFLWESNIRTLMDAIEDEKAVQKVCKLEPKKEMINIDSKVN
ncbi:glycosyltransferase family 4 protein [Lysinibacillus sp. 3P01SB]|uniref:glycosyltransferase family 4 protein n=1 Tax=Lysinibacillus sp. 3P01SB TaxID=3132284 RepID=UPI0039A76BFA